MWVIPRVQRRERTQLSKLANMGQNWKSDRSLIRVSQDKVTGHYEAPWSDAILTNMILEMENGTNYTQDSAHGAQEREDGDGQNSMRALLGFVLFLLIISTLLGNTLVCAAVVKFRHLRSKVTNFFVISLAVSDLFVAVLVMPWEAISAVAGTWLFGRFCGIWIAFDIMCSTASILNLCIISVDRYWAIASPFRYERKMTHRVAFMMIGVAWTLSILISLSRSSSTGTWLRTMGRGSGQRHRLQRQLQSQPEPDVCHLVFADKFLHPRDHHDRHVHEDIRIAQIQIRRISSLERQRSTRKTTTSPTTAPTRTRWKPLSKKRPKF